jgi:hypothetical protein
MSGIEYILEKLRIKPYVVRLLTLLVVVTEVVACCIRVFGKLRLVGAASKIKLLVVLLKLQFWFR